MEAKEHFQTVVVDNCHILPIVQPSAFEVLISYGETQRMHQVEDATGGGAGAGDVACVLRNFGFH
jgi:hypothetical protein